MKQTKYVTVTDRVRGVLAERHVTHEQVARELRISRVAVTRRLMGRVPLTADELLVIAEVCDVPVSRFFDGVTSHRSMASIPEALSA